MWKLSHLTNDPHKNLNFTWNSLNLLKEVKSGSTVKAQYSYSYNAAKVKVQDSGNTNGYDYLGSLTLVKTNNTLTPEYNFGEGMIKGNEVMYFEKDHLGSIRSVLNTSGTVLEKNDYYPFGQRHANSSHVVTANNRYKFNGKENQTVGSLELLDYKARMYDGYIGRWLGSDPIGMLDDEWKYNIDTDELTNIGSRGEDEVQYVTIVNDDDKDFGEVNVRGASVYIVKLRGAVAVTNYDTGIPKNYNQQTGYLYSAKDFLKRKEIVSSGSNPIKTYIYQMEREGKAEPIHADEYWDIMGTSLGNFYAGSMFVQMSLDLIPGPSFNSSTKGFAWKTSFTPAEVTTAKELTSWQQFLKANAGKYSGKGWEKRAAADYYTSSFFKTRKQK